MNGKNQQRRPDRPMIPPPEEEDPRVSGGFVSVTRVLHKSHSLGLVTGDCLFNQFFLLMPDFPTWKLLTGRKNHTVTLRGNFTFMEGHIEEAFCTIAYL
jgi:hypothetical protein